MEKDKRIEELEEVIRQMKKATAQEELLTFPWVGNLGQWYWMIQSNNVVFNDRKVTILGYDMKELPKAVGFEFFTDKLHPDDYKRVMTNMMNHLTNKTDVYEVEYRIRAKNGEYLWYYDRGKITKRDEQGKPLVLSGIVFDITANKEMERSLQEANLKLNKMVMVDQLTKAYNRRFILEKLNEEIIRFDRTKSSFSLIMLDVDNFKKVNDNFGHNIGDIVLKKLAELIMQRIRKMDYLCRWGGEEFIILLPETTTANAVVLAENLRTEISEMIIDNVGNITASFGVTSFLENDNIDSLIKKVDDLMYKAKESGRNCVKY